jgi:hypothetical protein
MMRSAELVQKFELGVVDGQKCMMVVVIFTIEARAE